MHSAVDNLVFRRVRHPCRGSLDEATREFTEVREARGEICLVVEGCGGGLAGGGAGGGGGAAAAGDPEAVERVLRELLAEGTSVSSAVKEVRVQETGTVCITVWLTDRD